MMRRCIALILALAVCMGIFSACMNEDSYPPALELSSDVPPRQGEETLAQGEFEATLYYINEDGTRLAGEKRTVRCEEGESMALCTMRALMDGPQSQSLERSVPYKLKLDKVEKSMGICNVYLSGGFPGSESDWLIARLAIAATLSDTLGIQAVNVLYNGKEQGYNSNAIGEARYLGQSLDKYAEDMAEKYPDRSKGSMSEVVKYINQYVTMYFTNAERTLIAAHSVQLSVSSEASVTDLVTILTGKLAAGISGEDALEPVLPADFTLAREPRIGVAGMEEEETDAESSAEKNTSKDKTGEASSTSAPSSLPLFAPKVIYITIKQPKNDYDERLMCAALTLTLTGYLPGISGIVLYVEAEDGTRTKLVDDVDYLTRDMYTDMLGTSVSVDYPDENGSMLKRENKIVPSSDEYDLTKRVLTLIDAQGSSGLGFAPLSRDDVERVYLADGIAVIEWKEGFTDKLKEALSYESAESADRLEMLIIYSFVNTLTELPYIKKVWMSEGGEKLGMINRIYLGNALLRSPGLTGNE